MSQQEVKIFDTPEQLQAAVANYIEKFPHSKTLIINQYIDTPYKDKSIQTTRYVAFLEHGNIMVTLECEECSDPKYEWSDGRVKESSMLVGFMNEFLKHSSWFKF